MRKEERSNSNKSTHHILLTTNNNKDIKMEHRVNIRLRRAPSPAKCAPPVQAKTTVGASVVNLNNIAENELPPSPPSRNDANIRSYSSSNISGTLSRKIKKRQVSTADLGEMIAHVHDKTAERSKFVTKAPTGAR